MYICKICSNQSPSKLGKCPSCGNFGTFETLISEKSKSKSKIKFSGNKINISKQTTETIFFGIENFEFKRVFQSGIKKGGVYLIGGEPGIGKSTLILQILLEVLKLNSNLEIGYFSGEESKDQINQRLIRLNKSNLDNIQIFFSTSLEDIITTIETNNFSIIVIDSIQTIYSSNIDSTAGSASQVRYCSEKLSEICKENLITGIIIGHVTKLGEIAGPKYLEHIVDVVLYLEGDRFGQYRFLRSYKNRFGGTDDVGFFEMKENGLNPVYNVKEIVFGNHIEIPGNILTVGIDNARPVIVNVEVLLNKTKYKYPERKSIGVDINRLSLIIAILEKYLNIDLGFYDIFVNIPGEFKFYDSGIDLGIAIAVYSSYKNITVKKDCVFLGEVGLGGQILK